MTKTDTPKISKWKYFWLNKHHYQLYIFSLAVLALVIAFTINFASISVIYNKNVSESYANTTVFTPSTVTSLSGVPVQVMMFRVNQAKNQMFLLLQISDMQNISLDINNYEIYITNADKRLKHTKMPKEHMRGQYYMFGATGFAGVYIYTDTQFSDDYKWITVRNYKPVTVNRQPYIAYSAADARYDKYNIFVNPGAKSVQTINFLDANELGGKLNPVQIYK
jgi:hypothetical protein